MLKSLRDELDLKDPVISVLVAALAAQVVAWFAFFVVLPQSWSLIDDYMRALQAAEPGFSAWAYFKKLTFHDHMSVGRFKPINDLAIAFRMDWLPHSPRAYRAGQWLLNVGLFGLFYGVLRKLGLTTKRALLGTLIASFAFSVKDLLLYWTTSEQLMLLFFFASFLAYLSGRHALAFGLFVCSTLSKEPAVAFLAPYYAHGFAARKRLKKKDFIFLGAILAYALAFVVYLKTLPQLYTTSYTLANVSLSSAVSATIKPLIKNYALVLLIGALLWVRKRGRVAASAALPGLALALGYTFFMVPWGPFDSWFYLHAPVPFGWAMAIAAVWPTETVVSSALIAAFGLIVTINGSSNYREFLSEGKVVAEIVCDESVRNPGIQYFSNCYEAANQLMNSLKLENRCEKIPRFKYVGRDELSKTVGSMRQPYVFVASSKCDYQIDQIPAATRMDFRYWTVYKNLQ